jgi:hypothetical protein
MLHLRRGAIHDQPGALDPRSRPEPAKEEYPRCPA